MRRILLPAFLSLLLSTSPTWALSGGPFSGNTNDATGPDGVYQGTMTGENLIGLVIFQWTRQLGSSSGRYVVFHRGVTSTGVVDGIVDTFGETIGATYTGGDSSGGFMGEITNTAPVLMFEGEGQYHGPELAITQGQTIFTTTVDVTTTTGVAPAPVTTTTVTTTTTDDTSQTFVETVPFTIRGMRTSLQTSLTAVATPTPTPTP